MEKYGLLGEKLGHSYSPEIHGMLGDYEYVLYEKNKAEVSEFLLSGNWTGLNVTIPYKKTAYSLMDELGDWAKATGSVNTVIKGKNGRLYGDNTDVTGFLQLVRHSGIPVENRKTLVLGNGGAAGAVLVSLKELGAVPVVISRSGEDNYENLDRHRDASVIVNTTPLGMFPKNGGQAVDLSLFPKLEGVIDLIYNPDKTALLLQAEKLGIPAENGLYMLVAQAKRSAELFLGKEIPEEETQRIYREMRKTHRNIVLIGMPGVGKSTAAAKIGKRTGRRVLDSDRVFTEKFGKTPAEVLKELGEKRFRSMETEVLEELGKQSGAVIATGGGAVTVPENYPLLHQNGVILWLRRDLSQLSTRGRPLSLNGGLEDLYRTRKPLYEAFADGCIDLQKNMQADEILQKIDELF